MPKLTNLTDEQVVSLVRTEDKEIYSEIMTRYQPKLTRYANYLISDSDHAGDAVQQGFTYSNVTTSPIAKTSPTLLS